MRFSYLFNAGEFSNAQLLSEQKIAHAATATIRDAAVLAKQAGRKAIAEGGFSTRWQNALRAEVYPKTGDSLHPAAVVHLRIARKGVDYAGVFESGATIEGHPLLWLPTDNAPMGRGGARLSPADYVATIGPLIVIDVKGRPPMLAAPVRVTGAALAKGLSTRALKRGTNSKRGQVLNIPMYVGVPSITDPARFNVTDAIKEVEGELPELYLDNFVE